MKKWLPLIAVVGTVTVCFILIAILNKNSPRSELEKLPALMDAKGRVEVEVGEFMLEKQPFTGSSEAPVKIIEFIDYKCPSCAEWENSIYPVIKEKYIETGLVQFYTINFPFLGPDSILAASAGEAIYRQSPEAFFEFKEKLLLNQGKEARIWATESFLLKFVKDNVSGIDQDQFKKDLKEHAYLFDVKEDFKISAANGIYGTPSFVVNGEKSGASLAELEQAIQKHLPQ